MKLSIRLLLSVVTLLSCTAVAANKEINEENPLRSHIRSLTRASLDGASPPRALKDFRRDTKEEMKQAVEPENSDSTNDPPQGSSVEMRAQATQKQQRFQAHDELVKRSRMEYGHEEYKQHADEIRAQAAQRFQERVEHFQRIGTTLEHQDPKKQADHSETA